MTINFNYDPNFTSNYVDRQLEESPFIEMLNVGYKGVTFLKQLFRNYPQYFGDLASTLFYIEYAGKTIKPDILYLAFEHFMTNSNNNVIKAQLNNIPLYTINQDPIIQWARYLQSTSKFSIFEPAMALNNSALKSFISNNKEFNYKNTVLSIAQIKPLCVTNVGENIAELIMYVAYLYNFFINCKPYIFNEVVAGSSAQLFMEAVNNHINAKFTKLINEGTYINPVSKVISNTFKFKSLDEFYGDVSNIKVFNEAEVKTIIGQILNSSSILELRNTILRKNDSMLTLSTQAQDSLTQEYCYKSFLSVIENLIDIVIKFNYYNVSIFSKFPKFNENNVDYHDLFMLTQFAMTGGWHPFVINEYEQYEASGDPKALENYPMIKEQRLITNIKQVSIADKKPFCSANIYMDIVTGYIYQKFEEYQNEVFSHPPILMEEKDIELTKEKTNNETMDIIINKLYLNGKFALHSSQLKKALTYLYSKEKFKREYSSIFNLANLFTVLYNNKFGAKILPAYILSYLPEYLCLFMNNNKTKQSLDMFNFISFFVLHHKSVDASRLQKLYNMEMGVLHLFDDTFVNFVNDQIDDITKIINNNSYIIQPYMIGTSSSISVVPIGGISLGSKFIDSNPLSRGYYFVVNTQGNSEYIHGFYKFVKNINSETMLNLISEAVRERNDTYLKELLNTVFTKLQTSGKLPLSLLRFSIDSTTGKYSTHTSNFYNGLQTSNNIPIYKLVYTYAFNQIMAKDTQVPTFYSRQVYSDKSVSKQIENAIQFGNDKYPCSATDKGVEYELPYYEFSTIIKSASLSFIQPNGYKLIKVYTMNSDIIRNNLFFIFTQLNLLKDKQPVFNVYDTIQNNIGQYNDEASTNASLFTTNLSTFESSNRRVNELVNTPNHTFSANRMKLNGVDKFPITNVKNTF